MYSQSFLNRFLKRSFDLFFSPFCLIVLSPLFVLIPILIKKDSPGPAFFRQERVGKDGKKFLMYKFRTMYVESYPYAITPRDNLDPRITKVGRYLRQTSLDEIPQFINVFKGEMSIVGPRPEMPFIVKEYNELYKKRLSVKPGVTGLWQLYGDKNKPIHENIEYDLAYIEGQSFFEDLEIIFKTGRFVLSEMFQLLKKGFTPLFARFDAEKRN